jgi:hypothetical protein
MAFVPFPALAARLHGWRYGCRGSDRGAAAPDGSASGWQNSPRPPDTLAGVGSKVSFIMALLLQTHSRKHRRNFEDLESVYEGVKFHLPYHRNPAMTMPLKVPLREVAKICTLSLLFTS